MKCQSRIHRVFKTRKAEPIWPFTEEGEEIKTLQYGKETLDVTKLPVCGGDVDVKIKAEDEPYYGGSSATLTAEFTCSNCMYPWIPERRYIESAVMNGELNISAFLDAADMTELTKAYTKERRAYRATLDKMIATRKKP